MRVINPTTGKVIDVTDRAYELVYRQRGFKIHEDEPVKEKEPEAPAVDKLTEEEYQQIMKNRENVEAELQKLGIDYDNGTGVKADDLRRLLNAVLLDKGLLPDGY